MLGSVGGENTGKADPYSGGRFALAYWLTDDDPWAKQAGIRLLGAEARLFFLGQRSTSFSDGLSPNLVRPFFDFNNRMESAVIVAAPAEQLAPLITEALRLYAEAEQHRPPGNDDALLRWNTCARIIEKNRLVPREEESIEPPLE